MGDTVFKIPQSYYGFQIELTEIVFEILTILLATENNFNLSRVEVDSCNWTSK